jgi:hypothetical protein
MDEIQVLCHTVLGKRDVKLEHPALVNSIEDIVGNRIIGLLAQELASQVCE